MKGKYVIRSMSEIPNVDDEAIDLSEYEPEEDWDYDSVSCYEC